jgi:hypothetical protein
MKHANATADTPKNIYPGTIRFLLQVGQKSSASVDVSRDSVFFSAGEYSEHVFFSLHTNRHDDAAGIKTTRE